MTDRQPETPAERQEREQCPASWNGEHKFACVGCGKPHGTWAAADR